MPDPYLLMRRVHLFSGLGDDQLRQVAESFERREFEPHVAVFHQGDPSDSFYLIEQGTVAIVREKGTRAQTVAHLSDGDYFGEMGLIYDRPRSASAQTETPAILWQLSDEAFRRLLGQFPQIKNNLAVVVDTRRTNQRKQFDWMEPDEVIYLIAGKHMTLFFLSMLPGAAGLLLAMAAAAAGWYYLQLPIVLYLFVPVALVAIGWMIWRYIDWDNDLYIVTNKRVVDFQKIVLIYDSRSEAPLGTCRNVNVATDQFGRIFGYGDVVVNTFSGNINFRHIPNPHAAAVLIQEQINRQRTRAARADRQALKKSLRQSMGIDKPPDSKTTPIKPVRPDKGAGPVPIGLPNPITQALGHFTFKVRTEMSGTVTYHKHPIVLAQSLALPTLLFAGLVAALAGRLLGSFVLLDVPTFLVAWLVPVAAVALWWLYQYENWRNDIYQVTPEQIVDTSRRPLGQELRKTAPLANILSIKTDRPGLLALALNFGSVVIQTGPGGEMRFEGIFNPLEVQQDIFRRMELRQQKAQAEQVAAERDRLSKVLGAFYEITLDEQRDRLSQRQRALREEAALVDSQLHEIQDRIAVYNQALTLAPQDGLDDVAIGRLEESLARAGEEYTVVALRRKGIESGIQALEQEMRQMIDAVEVSG